MWKICHYSLFTSHVKITTLQTFQILGIVNVSLVTRNEEISVKKTFAYNTRVLIKFRNHCLFPKTDH